MVEWDSRIPALDILLSEAAKADANRMAMQALRHAG